VPVIDIVLIFLFATLIVAVGAVALLKTDMKIGIRLPLVSFNVEIGRPADRPADPLPPPSLVPGSSPRAIEPPGRAADPDDTEVH
jgi:hypothetical protein